MINKNLHTYIIGGNLIGHQMTTSPVLSMKAGNVSYVPCLVKCAHVHHTTTHRHAADQLNQLLSSALGREILLALKY